MNPVSDQVLRICDHSITALFWALRLCERLRPSSILSLDSSRILLWCGSGSCFWLWCRSESLLFLCCGPDPASQIDADPDPQQWPQKVLTMNSKNHSSDSTINITNNFTRWLTPLPYLLDEPWRGPSSCPWAWPPRPHSCTAPAGAAAPPATFSPNTHCTWTLSIKKTVQWGHKLP